MPKMYICIACHNPFRMGISGVVDDDENPICDNCAGIERDPEGDPWWPGETERVYTDLQGENPVTVTREEAFSKEPK